MLVAFAGHNVDDDSGSLFALKEYQGSGLELGTPILSHIQTPGEKNVRARTDYNDTAHVRVLPKKSVKSKTWSYLHSFKV